MDFNERQHDPDLESLSETVLDDCDSVFESNVDKDTMQCDLSRDTDLPALRCNGSSLHCSSIGSLSDVDLTDINEKYVQNAGKSISSASGAQLSLAVDFPRLLDSHEGKDHDDNKSVNQKEFLQIVVHTCKWERCQLIYEKLEDLVLHVTSEHVKLNSKMEYVCLWEGCQRRRKGFNARYKILVHLRMHTNERPHKCSVCGKTFTRVENLKIHMRCHTGEKPYTCPYEGCGKAYANSSDRFKHVRTHTLQKPYCCKMPGCGKSYTDPSTLRKHVRAYKHRVNAVNEPGTRNHLASKVPIMPAPCLANTPTFFVCNQNYDIQVMTDATIIHTGTDVNLDFHTKNRSAEINKYSNQIITGDKCNKNSTKFVKIQSKFADHHTSLRESTNKQTTKDISTMGGDVISQETSSFPYDISDSTSWDSKERTTSLLSCPNSQNLIVDTAEVLESKILSPHFLALKGDVFEQTFQDGTVSVAEELETNITSSVYNLETKSLRKTESNYATSQGTTMDRSVRSVMKSIFKPIKKKVSVATVHRSTKSQLPFCSDSLESNNSSVRSVMRTMINPVLTANTNVSPCLSHVKPSKSLLLRSLTESSTPPIYTENSSHSGSPSSAGLCTINSDCEDNSSESVSSSL